MSCLNLEPEAVNLKLRWLRVQVGLDTDKLRDGIVTFLIEQPHEWFDDYAPSEFSHWLTPDNRWRFDPSHPLNVGARA